MSVTFDFLFYPKKPKGYSSGPVKLYLRVTVDSRRCETSTARSVLPENWDRKAQKMIGQTEEVKSFNVYLKILQNNLFNCHRELLQSGDKITAERLVNSLTGKGESPHCLVQIFKEHNKNIEILVGKEYSRPTLVKYNTTLTHLVSFLKWKYNH